MIAGTMDASATPRPARADTSGSPAVVLRTVGHVRQLLVDGVGDTAGVQGAGDLRELAQNLSGSAALLFRKERHRICL